MCCDSTGEFEVQLSQLSHFHELSMFGPFLIGARIMQVVAYVCINVSCHLSRVFGQKRSLKSLMNANKFDFSMCDG